MIRKFKLFCKRVCKDLECGLHSGFKLCCVFSYFILGEFTYFYCPRIWSYSRYLKYFIGSMYGEKENDAHWHTPCFWCAITNSPAPKENIKRCDRDKHKYKTSLEEIKEISQYRVIKGYDPMMPDDSINLKIDKLVAYLKK
jgi:hypothetical protein